MRWALAQASWWIPVQLPGNFDTRLAGPNNQPVVADLLHHERLERLRSKRRHGVNLGGTRLWESRFGPFDIRALGSRYAGKIHAARNHRPRITEEVHTVAADEG